MTDPTNIDHPGYWSDRYRTGRAGWDLGTPTPVFGELLRTAHFRPGRGREVLTVWERTT